MILPPMGSHNSRVVTGMLPGLLGVNTISNGRTEVGYELTFTEQKLNSESCYFTYFVRCGISGVEAAHAFASSKISHNISKPSAARRSTRVICRAKPFHGRFRAYLVKALTVLFYNIPFVVAPPAPPGAPCSARALRRL
ncbi:hypothetical protein EVAR_30075_1 [Eumeta japonica]|uniref:Uncharacterized protein n=1 Tax=Eumeta variegata TaxID=151549 RepID=A0A4C1X7N0_EUMVA|nr:hypothetical protein EVAR_30075_1 [Eumeta japonica]